MATFLAAASNFLFPAQLRQWTDRFNPYGEIVEHAWAFLEGAGEAHLSEKLER